MFNHTHTHTQRGGSLVTRLGFYRVYVICTLSVVVHNIVFTEGKLDLKMCSIREASSYYEEYIGCHVFSVSRNYLSVKVFTKTD